jgi:glycine betaine catabolism B
MREFINCEISRIKEETPDTRTLTLNLETALPFIPGQFINVWFREGPLADNLKAGRPYSISSCSLNPRELDITIRVYPEGLVSPGLFNSEVGTKLKVRGPYGRFVFKEEKDIVMIAAGSGIAPFIGFVKEIVGRKLDAKMSLLYSDKTEKDLIAREYFESIDSLNSVFSLTRDEWAGEKGRIDESKLTKHIPDVSEKTFFICGPPTFVNDIVRILKSLNVQDHNIKLEKYD